MWLAYRALCRSCQLRSVRLAIAGWIKVGDVGGLTRLNRPMMLTFELAAMMCSNTATNAIDQYTPHTVLSNSDNTAILSKRHRAAAASTAKNPSGTFI